MKKLLITTAALSLALVGCKTTEPPTFEQETNDIYVWDDSKSTAKNWADIAVVPNGVKDAERAEDAQELISEAEQNAWTLVSFASGGLAQGLGMNALFGVIDDAQIWGPTFVVLTEPQQHDHESILKAVDNKFKSMFENIDYVDYHAVSYRTFGRHIANAALLVSGDVCSYTATYKNERDQVLSMPADFEGCFIAVSIELMPRTQLQSGEVVDVISVEQMASIQHSLIFAGNFDGPVVFPTNYPIRLNGKETTIPFPFVHIDGQANLFTETNDSIPLKASKG